MESEEKRGASPSAKRWLANRSAAFAAAADDRRAAKEDRDRQEQQAKRDYDNPTAFWLGLLAFALVLVAAYFVIDAMSCDPFYSDAGMTHGRACR